MTRTLRPMLTIALMVSACWLAQAGTASGTLEVNGNTYQITHAYGLQIENSMTKGESATLLLLSDRPLPEKLLNENVSFFDLRDAGMNGLKMEFYSNGENYAMIIVGAGIQGSFSSSGTFDRSQFTAYEPVKIAGKISNEKNAGETSFKYEISFDTDILPRKPKVMPTAEEMKSAQSTGSAKAYIAFNQAVREGRLDAIRAGVIPERAEMMNKPEFEGMLSLIQSMMPADIVVVKATETGDNAELELTGKDDGKEKSGTASLVKIDGKWLVQGESWK